jgi:hypothetical protein
MATYLMVRGMEPVELAESFNFVRKRLNDVEKAKLDYDQANIEEFQPYHLVSFKTADGGRFSPNYSQVLGVGSNERRDVGSSSSDGDGDDSGEDGEE